MYKKRFGIEFKAGLRPCDGSGAEYTRGPLGFGGLGRILAGRPAASVSVARPHSQALVTSVVFSSDGQLLASASTDCRARLWGTATGAARSTLEGHSDSVNSVVFSPDGQLLASVPHDRAARLWDTVTGAARGALKSHWAPVDSVAFSPDDQLLASASRDRTARLWDTATEAARGTLNGHSDSVIHPAFSYFMYSSYQLRSIQL